MKTVMYLVRHGATAANLAEPYRLQGRCADLPLAPLGIRQAEATRAYLAGQPITHCYCSPLRRAVQTAAIIAQTHGLSPQPLEALTECDVGRWEGLDWQTIQRLYAEAFRLFQDDPGVHGYPGGESFQDVHRRVSPALAQLLAIHEGETILVVSHHIVNRTYLAGLLGLPMKLARQVTQDNCGIALIEREANVTTVSTSNAVLHLQGVTAA